MDGCNFYELLVSQRLTNSLSIFYSVGEKTFVRAFSQLLEWFGYELSQFLVATASNTHGFVVSLVHFSMVPKCLQIHQSPPIELKILMWIFSLGHRGVLALFG